MIAENFRLVQERIDAACGASGRDPSGVTLIAVSKTHSVPEILVARALGMTHFGENRAQEFRDKAAGISEPVTWHFIGNLQKNKIKYIIDKVDYIHSVDSVSLADALSREAEKRGRRVKILLEAHTSGEETKQGIETERDLLRIADHCADLSGVTLCGLMTMAAFTDDMEEIRACFRRLRGMQDFLRKNGHAVPELSMGMTNDFEIAVAEGATMLRVGTAIFGERMYNQ